MGSGRRERGGLTRHRDFRLLWLGESVSQVGSQVSVVALPLVAVLYLHASTFEVAALTALQFAAFLLVGLPAGAWCDRLRRRPVMIAGDLMRAVLMASVPGAAALGVLTIGQLFVVAALHGLCTTFFDVSYQSYLPSLVSRSGLIEGNAKLQASQSVAQVAGPSAGGLLAQLLTAPLAVAVDAVSFVVSAVCIAAIRKQESTPPRPEQRRLSAEIGEGLRFVLGHRILRMIAGCTATYNLFSAAFEAVIIVFLARSLHLPAGAIGLLMAAGAVGGVIGAVTAGRIGRKIGQARTIWLSVVATSPFALLIPLTHRGPTLALYPLGAFVLSAGAAVYDIAQVSFRQGLCPPRLLGRMNATMRFLVWGTWPLGALLGGALGTWIGLRPTLWVSAAGGVLAGGWLLASPLRRMRDLPSIDPEPPAPEVINISSHKRTSPTP